ncbi:MAG: ATP-binding protein [Ignisphaera sp.]|uniref:ATP-binding protein n=1 Tax=Ignisphaera aggregans TaxID=334771 RepID=A0A7J3MYP7_9CREN
MLFDPRPKTNRNELFGRDQELEILHKNIDSPLTIISGIRRIGKTSLLSVFLNEVDIPSVLIDLRSLHTNYGLRDLYSLISKAFSSRLDKLYDVLKSISGISIRGVEVEIKWRGRGSITLSSLFDALNRKRIIVAFDEAQKLRGPRSQEFLNALAHAYDYDRNITFILTGSEIGLLYGFLGIDKHNSPLYGRYCFNLKLERFDRDTSLEFLKTGFRELRIDVKMDVLEIAVEEFGGIPGWLTFFGNEYSKGNKDIVKIKELAIGVALGELQNIVRERGKRYALVLKGIAKGITTWSSLKRYVEEKEGVTISSSILYNIVKNLEDMSIIHNYQFLDPIYREASLRIQIT